MRKLIIFIVIIVGLLVAGLAIIPSLVPSSVYKEKIQTQLTKELGRNVIIDGDVKLAVFPTIRAKTDRVTIKNPDGFKSENFAAMDGLDAKVKLLPLFSKRVEISSFNLRKPVINLEKNSQGHANWALETQNKDVIPVKEDKGSFKRDGRYADLDPAVGLFSLEDGAITYYDATTKTSYNVREANLRFSLPSLAKPIAITGDLILNNEPVKVDLSLDTPRAFLDGKEAPITIDFSTEFATLKAKGEFTASQDIAFNLNLDGEVMDIAALSSYLPTDQPIAALAKTASLKGAFSYDGKTLSGSDADIEAEGDLIDLAYKGGFKLSEKPVLDGSVNVNAKNIVKLADILKIEIKGVELARTATLSATLSAEGSGFSASNITANIKGDGLDAAFTGSGAYGDTLSANGNFTATAASAPALVRTLELDIPQVGAIQNIDIKGKVDYNGKTTRLLELVADTTGGAIEGRYRGNVTSGDTVGFDGTFETQITSLSEFAKAAGTDIPYSNAIESVSASGKLNGSGKNVTVTDLDAQLQDGQLNGRFQGMATTAEGFNVEGLLNADIPSIRTLAATAGANLPQSTSAGTIYEAFSVSGKVKGNPVNISFSNAGVALDHLKGTGNFSVNMKGPKPFVSGILDMEGLDLRPYMSSYAAQNPTGEIQPWSDQPLNLSMLKAVDGDLKFKTPSMTTDRMKMGAANLDVKLRNGVMNASVPKLNMYGGLGKVTASLDVTGQEPAIALDLNMRDLNSNTFLAAVAGFTNATGEGGTGLSIRGSGSSQAAIMKSLNGQGDFKLLNGQISGVDLEQLLTGLDQAIATRALPSGVGSNYITKFNDIIGLFKVENGVVKVDNFSLNSLGVAAQGAGQIDLGGQSVDFSLRPRLTGKTAGDLSSFGIPIRVKGGFGDASIGLDTQLLTDIAAAKAKSRLQKELTDQVGGPVGNILGGILGGNNPSSSPQTPSPNSQGQNAQPQQPTAEDAVADILGGLFGKKSKEEPKTEKGKGK